MENKITRSLLISDKLKVKTFDCDLTDTKRTIIRTKMSDGVSEKATKKAIVIGINPSKATNDNSDKTLTTISKYLYQYGVGELAMINLFETRSPHQKDIKLKHESNLENYKDEFNQADLIVVAWGIENTFPDTKEKAIAYLYPWRKKVYCIQDKDGNKPRHPRGMAYSYDLVSFYSYETKSYPVVTLCGSTRFKDEFMEAQKRLTLQGYIVISVGLFGHSGDEEVWENMVEGTLTKTKEMLDDMHKRKIDMADEIYVINVGDYIGDSTKSEIAYAKAHGIKVNYLEPHKDEE